VTPLAHARWFVDAVPPNDWSFATEPRTLLYLGVAVLVTLAVRVAARFLPGRDVPVLRRLVPWMPFAVRVHLAVALVGLLSAGAYLAPTMNLDLDPGGVALGLVMAASAILLVTGWHARAGAVLLVLAGPVGMLVFGFGWILQRADMLGLALFVLVAGAGRWSADHELGRAADAGEERLGLALWLLRIAVGIGLIAVGFGEKLANPALAQRFLDRTAHEFNLFQLVGLPVGDLEWIRVWGATEVLFGLLLISGALPRLLVFVVGIPFNATLYFFGLPELLGHLPVYATLLLLLVYGSDPRLSRVCWELWPWRPRRRVAAERVPSHRPAASSADTSEGLSPFQQASAADMAEH